MIIRVIRDTKCLVDVIVLLFLLYICSDYNMIHDRNKFITVTVSYDFINGSFYTCHDYHMILNRKRREMIAFILCCIYHLYRWRRRRHRELVNINRAGAG